MKKILALLLALMLVFAGCKSTDSKQVFLNALDKQGEVKNAHETAAFTLVMDNGGTPYTFMDVKLEGDINLESYDMAVDYDFTIMDITLQMELYKKGEDILMKMPIFSKYFQIPADMIPVSDPEGMKSLQTLLLQENKGIYEQMGDSIQYNKKGSETVATYELDGAATKALLNDVFVEKILKNEEFRKESIDKTFESQKKTWESYGFADDFTEEDWASMRQEAEEAYDSQIESYVKILEKMEIESLKGESRIGKDGFVASSNVELKFSLYETPMTLQYSAAFTNVNKVSDIKLPELNASSIINYNDLIRGKVDIGELNPFFGMIERMQKERMEEYWNNWEEEADTPSVPLPETGTPARPSI